MKIETTMKRIERLWMKKTVMCALATSLLAVLLFTTARATQVEINGPTGSGAFGTQVVVLPNGNIVVTDSNYGEGGVSNVGAVYLYNGATLALISALKGGTTNDQVGFVIVLGNFEIYVMNANGTGLTRLTNNSAVDAEPAWDSTGNIAFTSTRDGATEIYSMNADGTGLVRLTTHSAWDISPHWWEHRSFFSRDAVLVEASELP